MNIICTFHISVSGYGTLVKFKMMVGTIRTRVNNKHNYGYSFFHSRFDMLFFMVELVAKMFSVEPTT